MKINVASILSQSLKLKIPECFYFQIRKLKEMMTDVLMSVTSSMIREVAGEVLEKSKRRANAGRRGVALISFGR